MLDNKTPTSTHTCLPQEGQRHGFLSMSTTQTLHQSVELNLNQEPHLERILGNAGLI